MFKRFFFIAFVALFLLRCSNKLEILAPYKEGIAVFGLLNQNDAVQYIRIQRVFLGEGNALSMAQNPDSCYYKPGDLKVTLQRIKNGSQISVDNPASAAMEIVLTEAYVQTQPGIFNSNQLLYQTNHTLYEDGSQYKLVIHSNKTGKDFSSSNVGLIGDFSTTSVLSYAQQHSVLTQNPPYPNPIPAVPIVPSNKGVVICKFNSPVNAAVCGLTLRLYYTEYATAGTPVSKYVDLGLGIQYLKSTQGSEEVDLTFSGDGMINDIANAIKVDPNVNHRTADSVHFILNGAGYDLSLYNQVNSSTSLSQTKPTYTNINGGVGVFSCRKEYALLKKISDNSKDRLADDPITCPLHFYNHGGQLSTSCP